MIYKIGDICKHFKGTNLLEKNIYKIIDIEVDGSSLNENIITYTGDKVLKYAKNLIVYANIFQENKMFAREYEDISSVLSDEKQAIYNQRIKVEPLTQEEIKIINTPEFIEQKTKSVLEKYKNN